jgi:hypothetical protein
LYFFFFFVFFKLLDVFTYFLMAHDKILILAHQMVEQIDEISEVLAALRSLAFFYLILKVDEVVTCLFQLLLY